MVASEFRTTEGKSPGLTLGEAVMTFISTPVSGQVRDSSRFNSIVISVLTTAMIAVAGFLVVAVQVSVI